MASASDESTPIKQFTRSEVKKHNSFDDLWLVLDNNVYDMSDFLYKHPGGEEVLLDRAGGDGTDCFDNVGHSLEAKELRETFKIGEIVEGDRLQDKHQGRFDGEYGRKFQTPTSMLYDYMVPIGIVIVSFVYFFLL